MTIGASSSSPQQKWIVFLSYRTEDTGNSFTSFLNEALVKEKIPTFKDNKKLTKGEYIGPQLEDAIKGCKIGIAVISENYASSIYCCMELEMFFQYKKKNRLTILPIFYKVEPSDYKYIARAVMKRKEHFQKEMEKLESWKLIFKEEIKNVESWELVKVKMEKKGLWERFKEEMQTVKLWERFNKEMENEKLSKTVITNVQQVFGYEIDKKTDEPEFIKKFVKELPKIFGNTIIAGFEPSFEELDEDDQSLSHDEDEVVEFLSGFKLPAEAGIRHTPPQILGRLSRRLWNKNEDAINVPTNHIVNIKSKL